MTERKAGDGVSDAELIRQVGEQTDSELEQQDFFARETEGTVTETEAAKADADEAAGRDSS
jgi:hypothetical protein